MARFPLRARVACVLALSLGSLAGIAIIRSAEQGRTARADAVTAMTPAESGKAGQRRPATQVPPQFSAPVKRFGSKAFSIDGSVIPPRGNAVEVVRGLEAAARQGDSHAALLISLKLTECFSILAQDGDYNVLMEDSHLTGGVEAAMKRQAESLAQCEGLSQEDYQRRGEWLRLSADANNVLAQLLYARSFDVVIGSPAVMLKEPQRIIEYKGRAMDYLKRAASNGSTDALYDLGGAYLNGILTQRDGVRAYAYFAAGYKADGRVKPWGMEQLEASLSPQQRSEAIPIAKEIYRECCEAY